MYSVCLCVTCIEKCFSVNFLLLLVYPLSYIHSLSDLSTITHYASTGHMIAGPTVHIVVIIIIIILLLFLLSSSSSLSS